MGDLHSLRVVQRIARVGSSSDMTKQRRSSGFQLHVHMYIPPAAQYLSIFPMDTRVHGPVTGPLLHKRTLLSTTGNAQELNAKVRSAAM